MKKNVVADTSFYICNACNIKRTDRLLKYLNLYQFHAGDIILNKELPVMGTDNEKIRSMISCHDSYGVNYPALFKVLSNRDEKHIEEDGEYEAIGIAMELSLTDSLHCLILDDKGPKNFVITQLTERNRRLKGKVHGTLGFIRKSCLEDKLIEKEEAVCHLKEIHQSFLNYQNSGKKEHRPCSMDEHTVKTILCPLIKELEEQI